MWHPQSIQTAAGVLQSRFALCVGSEGRHEERQILHRVSTGWHKVPPPKRHKFFGTATRRHCQQKKKSHRREASLGPVHCQSLPRDHRIRFVRLAWRENLSTFECSSGAGGAGLLSANVPGSDASLMPPTSCRHDASRYCCAAACVRSARLSSRCFRWFHSTSDRLSHGALLADGDSCPAIARRSPRCRCPFLFRRNLFWNRYDSCSPLNVSSRNQEIENRGGNFLTREVETKRCSEDTRARSETHFREPCCACCSIFVHHRGRVGSALWSNCQAHQHDGTEMEIRHRCCSIHTESITNGICDRTRPASQNFTEFIITFFLQIITNGFCT